MDTRYTPQELRAKREQRGLTLAQMARETGINFTYLSRIETGVRRPSAATAIRLSQYYGEPLQKFWSN